MTASTVESLITHYHDAARRHGRAKSARAANKAAGELAAIYRELRQRGSDATGRLLVLLRDADPSVRCWVAAHALEFAPEQAVTTLEELAGGPLGPIRASASLTLREWRAGRLRFP